MRSMVGGWSHVALPAALALAPGAACAQDGGGEAGSGPVVWVLAVVTVLLLAGVIALYVRLRSLAAESARLRKSLNACERLESSAREQFIVWEPDSGAPRASSGLGPLIGDDAEPGYEALRGLLDGPAGESLDGAVAGLREDGRPFELTLPAGGNGRTLQFIGERLAAGGGCVLWVRDHAEMEKLGNEIARFKRLLDALPIPVWRRSASFDIDYANAAYVRAVEMDATGESETIPELAARVIGDGGRALAKRARADAAARSERHHIVMDGSRRMAEISEAPLDGSDEIAGYALDRTEIDEVRSELSRHTTGHEGVLHNLGTAIAIYSADQRLIFFNHAFMQLWRLEEIWLQSEPTLSEVLEALRERRLMPEYADFPMFKREQIKLFTSLLEPVEDLVHLPDGKTLRSVVAPHALGGLLFTWEDVTDALALERSYNTLIAVQRETLDNLYEGVAVIGGDGRLKLSNPAFGEMWLPSTAKKESEPHISTLVDHMTGLLGPDADWPREKEELIGLLTDREPRSGRLERTDDSVIDYATVPLPDGAVLLSFLDVSDSNRVERALRERNEALETADRLKTEFIASVSYELRTPLNTIIGFAELLTGEYFGELNARQTEYGRGILESSDRLLALINDILDLATIEANQMALDLDTVDVHNLLSNVIGFMRERGRSKRLSMRLDCPRTIGEIVADERRLKQALFNLLSNAVKFTPERGRITLSARRREDGVRLVCADTGIGIDEADRARVFDKFVRGSSPEARRSGAGLGLSLVKSFVELHGGEVELESEPGTGTKVSCWLPNEAVATVAQPPEESKVAEA